MMRGPPISTLSSSSAASDVYKRQALAPYPGSLLDTLHDAGHNKKQTMALLLYQMRLQKLYDLLPVREEQL